MSLLLWGGCMGNDSILPECGGLADYSDTKERKEMPQGRMVSFYLRFRFGHSYVLDNSYSWGTYFFRRTCRVKCPLKAAFCRDNGEERRQVASGTKEDVFAALTDIENTEKIYLDNGVYKRNTILRSSWDLRIVHEGDQQVSGHGERGDSSGVSADLPIFIPYFKNLCERNGYPFIGTAQETQQR